MYQDNKMAPSYPTSAESSWRLKLTAVALGSAWMTVVPAQSSPNWGADSTPSPVRSQVTTSPWSAAEAPTPTKPRGQLRHSDKPVVIPPALAEVLKRPDTEGISVAGGKTVTVREIRASVEKRKAVLTALAGGGIPDGRKRVAVAVFRSPQHEELLNVSKALRDASRREAGGAPSTAAAAPTSAPAVAGGQSDGAINWGAPRTGSGTGGQDPAGTWAGAGSGADPRSQRRQVNALAASNQMTQIHSGTGSDSPTWGAASKTPGSSTLSGKPAQTYVAQNTPAGIALVNGRAKGIQFTPGGLYTIIGTGFGDTIGSVDLVGPHLPGGRLGLPVTQWADRQLHVQFPEGVSGIGDQIVTLRVTTRSGTLLSADVQFFATRQALLLTGDQLDLSQVFDLNLGNPTDWGTPQTDVGTVTRTKSGDNINCPSVGKDTLRTKIPPGWTLAQIDVSTWLPTQSDPNKDLYGSPGDVVVSGNYSIKQIPAGITNQLFEVQWGVLRSHDSNNVFQHWSTSYGGSDYNFGWSGNDGCVSSYQIALTLVGPAGTQPF